MECACIFEFLSNTYQRKLIKLSQNQTDNYEEALQCYMRLFVSHLKTYLNNYSKCEEKKVCKYNEFCQSVEKVIEGISESHIENFILSIKGIYIKWVDAKWNEALEELEDILSKKKLLLFELQTAHENLYFRGRTDSGILTKMDMFHIPFNKRYLIRNQRYSLTGQPLVYLGSSVIDIKEEIELKGYDDLKISSVSILKQKKIYDFRNNIWNEVSNYYSKKLLDTGFDYEERHFFKLIFAQLCSFPKRKESNFCEEYVIPQLFAHLLKKKEFEGIYYYSTKEFTDLEKGKELNMEEIEKMYFVKENIALFTNFKEQEIYDDCLKQDLNISSPIQLSQITKISKSDIERIFNEIELTGNREKIKKAEGLVNKYLIRYDSLSVDGNEFIKTDTGSLQMYLLYSVLNMILVEKEDESKR